MNNLRKLMYSIVMLNILSNTFASSGDESKRDAFKNVSENYKQALINQMNERTNYLLQEAKIRLQGKNNILVKNAFDEMELDVSSLINNPRIRLLKDKLNDLKDKFRSFIKSYQQKDTDEHTIFINNIINNIKKSQFSNDCEVLQSLIMLLYAYVDLPGSIVQSTIKETTKEKQEVYDYYIRESRNYRQNIEYAKLSNTVPCPDKEIVGKNITTILPFFTFEAFKAGLVQNILTGDRTPIASIELKWGEWWNVYALDFNEDYIFRYNTSDSMIQNLNGILTRDMLYDDGYSKNGICTYITKASTSSIYYHPYNIKTLKLVFEKISGSKIRGNSQSFLQRVYAEQRTYLTRVYSELRAYYLRVGADSDARKLEASIHQIGIKEPQERTLNKLS